MRRSMAKGEAQEESRHRSFWQTRDATLEDVSDEAERFPDCRHFTRIGGKEVSVGGVADPVPHLLEHQARSRTYDGIYYRR